MQGVLSTASLLKGTTDQVAVSIAGLSTRQQQATLVAAGYNAKQRESIMENAKNAFSIDVLTTEEQKQVAIKVGLISAEGKQLIVSKLAAAQKIEEAIASKQITVAQGAQLMSTLGLTVAKKAETVSVWANIKAWAAWYASSPIGWIMAIVSAIGIVITVIANYNKKIQETIETGEQATQTMKQLASDFKSLKSSISDIAPEFAKLSQGVDAFGNNISLTEEEYARFLELSNQLADTFPTLSRTYDENGNAIVNLSGDIDTIVSSLQDLVDVERQLANNKILENVDSVYAGAKASTKQIEDDVTNWEKQLNAINEFYTKSNDGEIYFQRVINTQDVNALSKIKDAFGAAGVALKYYNSEAEAAKDTTFAGAKYFTIEDTDPNDPYGVRKIPYYIFDFDEAEFEKQLADQKNTLEKKINNASRELASVWGNLNTSVAAIIESDYKYTEMSSGMQTVTQTIASGLDLHDLADQGIDTQEELEEYINQNILLPLFNAGPEVDAAFSELFDWRTKLQNGEISAEDFAQKVRDAFSGLFESDPTGEFAALMISALQKIGVEIDDTAGVIDYFINQWGKLPNQVNQTALSCSNLSSVLSSLTSDTDDLQKAMDALSSNQIKFDELFSGEDGQKYLESLISKFPQLRDELELYSNGLISAEQLSKAFKSALAASNINALSDAFKNIRGAVETYGADSYEAKQATEAVADTLPGLNGKLVDAAGNYTVLGEAAITAANGNVDAAKSLIEAEIAAQRLNLQHAIDEMERVAKATYGAKIAMGIMRAEMSDMNSFGETGSSGVNNAKSAIAELEEMLDGLNSGKYKVDDGSSKSSGSSTDAYLEKYKQDLADIQFLRDMDYISEKEYYDKLRALNDERLKGKNEYLDEYRANLVALHDYDVKLFEEAKDAQVDALEKEKDALEDYYNDLIDAKEKEADTYKKAEKEKYEAAKKRYESEKKLLQKELDEKKKAIQKQIDLLSDQSDEKSHEEEVAESNKRIADIKAQIEEKSLDNSAKGKAERFALEEELVKETSTLEKSQYDWSVKTQRNALEKQMDQLEEYYDKLMENIDTALDHLEETFDAWLDNFETSIDAAIEDLKTKMEAVIASIDSQIQSVKSQTMAVSAPTTDTGETGGDNSSEIVKQLQSLLQNNGFSVGKQGVDGKLGKDTIRALQRYLNSAIGSGLKIDGVIGSATTAAINDAINKRILSSMFSVITSSSFPKYHAGGIVGDGNKKDIDLIGRLIPIDRNEVLAKLMKNEAVLTEGQQTSLGNIVTNLMSIISRQNGAMRPALAGAYSANTSPTFNVTYNVSGDVSKTAIADLEAAQKRFADYTIEHLSNNVRRTLNRYGK